MKIDKLDADTPLTQPESFNFVGGIFKDGTGRWGIFATIDGTDYFGSERYDTEEAADAAYAKFSAEFDHELSLHGFVGANVH